MSRIGGSLLVAWSVACAPQHTSGPQPAAAAVPRPDPKRAGPIYRFVPSSRLGRGEQALDAEHVAGLEPAGDARIVVASDGSIQRAPTPSDDRLMGGVPVPAHLGSGFLFWTTSALYRARTFTGPLEPIAPVSTNAIGVEFGPSSLLLFTPDGPPCAYALEPARQVPLSPHGALEIAAADAERAVAFDAAGRALASVDGGRSWKDVTATLGETAHGLRTEAHEVGFVFGEKAGAWLQRDGSFVRRPPAATSGKPVEKAFETLTAAVSWGLPLPNGHALIVDDGIGDVDLVSGQATALTQKLPYGSSCLPVSAEENGLLICFSYGRPHDSLAVVSGALSQHPDVEKVFQRTQPYTSPSFAIGDSVLIVDKSCAGLPVDGVACVRSLVRAANPGPAHGRKPAAWAEVNLQAALGTSWQVLYWVPKAKGGVAALAVESGAVKGSPKLALIDAASGALTPFDAPLEHVAPRGFTRNPERSFVVLEDGTLRGFTSTSGLAVDAKGHVSVPARSFKDVAGAGAFALAQDETARLWQTTDYGEHWVEVARPPFEPELPPVPANSFRGDLSRAIRCSLVGCALAHETGLGTWLRFGWPDDPPRAHELAQGAAPAPPESVPPLAPPAPAPAAPRPKLHCVAASAPVPPGRPLLTHGNDAKSASIEYPAVYSQDSLLSHGLRGVVRIARTGKAQLARSFEPLAATKAPFALEFVPPLEPAFRSVRAQGSLAAWTPLLEERARRADENALEVDLSHGSARPLLAATPGHAGGLLFLNQAFAFAATEGGKIHPIRPGCRADSGYVDAHGTLFVTCANRSGATALGDADHHRPVLRLPPAERFRDESGAGMSFFEPGRQLLTDPDAIAVAPDGKLAIVRTASGSQPPTVDVPAWLLSADAPPVELAPWSSLEPATSPACKKGGGYRTLIQTATPWFEVDGARFAWNAPGMSAIVRWSPERICLEAVEVGLREQAPAAPKPGHEAERTSPLEVLIVARFMANDTSAAFVGTSTTASVHEPAKCELAAP